MLRVPAVALRPLHQRLDQDADIPDGLVTLADEVERVIGIALPDRQVQHRSLAEIRLSALEFPVPFHHAERVEQDRPTPQRPPAPGNDREELSSRVNDHRGAPPSAFIRRQVVQRDRRALAGPGRCERHRRPFQRIGNQPVAAPPEHHPIVLREAPEPTPLKELRLSEKLGLRFLPAPFADNALHCRPGCLAQNVHPDEHTGHRQQVDTDGLPAFSQPVPGRTAKPQQSSPNPGLDHVNPHTARHGGQHAEPEPEAAHLARTRAAAEAPCHEAAEEYRKQQQRIRFRRRPPRNQRDRNAKTEQNECACHAEALPPVAHGRSLPFSSVRLRTMPPSPRPPRQHRACCAHPRRSGWARPRQAVPCCRSQPRSSDRPRSCPRPARQSNS